MNKLKKRINLVANVLIVVVLLLIGFVLIKQYGVTRRPTAQTQDYRVAVGRTISLPDVDWKTNEQTLLLVLDTGCRYCTASASFYQQIAREKRSVRLIAVFPQDAGQSKQYLSDLNVPIDEVRQSGIEILGVKGTPTLILINNKGEVVRSWAGKLPPEEEREVLTQIADKSEVE